jgi:hypothetical protein
MMESIIIAILSSITWGLGAGIGIWIALWSSGVYVSISAWLDQHITKKHKGDDQ